MYLDFSARQNIWSASKTVTWDEKLAFQFHPKSDEAVWRLRDREIDKLAVHFKFFGPKLASQETHLQILENV
jgi:hypothetical protein